MHRAAVHAHAGFQSALVGVEPLEKRQQRRVNIEDLARIVINEHGRQNPHKAREHHHVGTVLVDHLDHGALKVLARLKGLMVDHGRFDPHFLGSLETGGVGAVREHERDADAIGRPVFALAGLRDRYKIRAAARDQNDNVLLHGNGKASAVRLADADALKIPRIGPYGVPAPWCLAKDTAPARGKHRNCT